MQPGERIAIKAVFVRQHNLAFETWGNPVSVMAIKAIGSITENRGDGRRVSVSWKPVSPQREWYFYTHPSTWKVNPGNWKTDALIDFAFQNKPQDINRFRNAPYWRERFGTDPKDHKRFRWARFYQAIADGLLSHAADRTQLVAFLQELQPSVEGLGLLSSDQFADGRKGFIQDIDPFTLLGFVTPSHSLEGRSSRDWFAEVVVTELRPLLHEYWFDAPDVAEREADRLLEGW